MRNRSNVRRLEPFGFQELKVFPRNDDVVLCGEQLPTWLLRWEMLLPHFFEFPEESHPVPWNRGTWNRASQVSRTVTQRPVRLGVRKEKGRGKEGREGKRGVEDSMAARWGEV